MSQHLPPLSTLRAFEAVVRLGSVSRAAQELGRTHGAVSKQLRALHDHAGVALLEKAGTGLRANTAGRELAAAIARALEDLSAAYGEATAPARSPSLHVACSATFAMRWLVPHMASFTQAHPDVGIQLAMTSAKEMREARDADLVVLWDRTAYSAQDRERAIWLADAEFSAFAAPDYAVALNADGRFRTQVRIDHDHTSRAWDLWNGAGGARLSGERTISFPHTHLCIEAAVAGMGVAVVERRLVAQELKDGRLVAVGAPAIFPDGFAAIPRAGRPLSPQAELFIDWLRAELQASRLSPR